MSDPLPVSLPVRTTGHAARRSTRFDISPDDAERKTLAAMLGISGISRLRFTGEVRPLGNRDFELDGQLEAVVIQPCVISLDPVATTIREPVVRRYLHDFLPPAEDAEMSADDSDEPLSAIIDVGSVMAEALALALPDYPRRPGAVLETTVHTAPGLAPMQEADVRPFAGLARLVQRLPEQDDDSDS